MQLDQRTKSNLLSTSGSEMRRIEEYSVGTYVIETPEEFVIEIAGVEYSGEVHEEDDTEEISERQLNAINRESEDFDVYLDDDKLNCTSCRSPEARYVGVKVYNYYDRKTNKSYERDVLLRKLCSDCSCRLLLDHTSAVVTHDELKQRWCDKNGVRWYEPKMTPVNSQRDVTQFVYNPIGRGGLSSLGYAGNGGSRGIDYKLKGKKMEYWNDGRKIRSITAKPRKHTRYASIRLY